MNHLVRRITDHITLINIMTDQLTTLLSSGFRERKEPLNLSSRSTKQSGGGRKHSVESTSSFRSTSSSSQGPPHGTRVVLGRETSPDPTQSGLEEDRRLPSEITNKFSGQTREVR